MKNRLLLNITFIITLTFFFASTLNAQRIDDIKLRDRLFFGTYLNISFGTYTDIEVSPFAGYKITKRLWSGLGINYMLYGYSYLGHSNYNSFYGMNVFSKFTLLRNFPSQGTSIFAHGEFLELNMKDSQESKRYFQEFYFIGGGLRQYLGGRMNIEIMVLFDVQKVRFSPYNSPVFRVGIIF